MDKVYRKKGDTRERTSEERRGIEDKKESEVNRNREKTKER